LLTFFFKPKIERKKLWYSKELSLFPLTHGAVVDRYFIIISWCHEFHTFQKNMHFCCAKYVETRVSSLLHIIDS
jgi:hypothetical protein